jgi:DNA-binding transcriptional ArsR family regulator
MIAMDTADTAPADELARIASVLADRSRARMCTALLDGREWTAGRLADAADVAPSTATEHLGRLVAGGLVAERRAGRHRYVRLLPPAADLMEVLLEHVGPVQPARHSLASVTEAEALARGRTCYDHLAGRLGVAVTEAMVARGLLEDGLAVTEAGMAWLVADLGADLTGTRRRRVSRSCLDWTERRPHLAGAAGAHVCAHFRSEGWIRSVGRSRAVRLTPAGAAAVGGLLGLTTADL